MIFPQSTAAQRCFHACRVLSVQAADHTWQRARRGTGHAAAPGRATAPDHRSGLSPSTSSSPRPPLLGSWSWGHPDRPSFLTLPVPTSCHSSGPSAPGLSWGLLQLPSSPAAHPPLLSPGPVGSSSVCPWPRLLTGCVLTVPQPSGGGAAWWEKWGGAYTTRV